MTLLAQSGQIETSCYLAAFGGGADIRQTQSERPTAKLSNCLQRVITCACKGNRDHCGTSAPSASVSGNERRRAPDRLADCEGPGCEGRGLSIAPRHHHRARTARRGRRPDRAYPCRSSDGHARPARGGRERHRRWRQHRGRPRRARGGGRLYGQYRQLAQPCRRERRELARQFGAAEVIDPAAHDMVAAIRELTHGEGAHKTLDASSAPDARAAAVRAVRAWGTACFVGERGQVTLDISADLLRRQVTLVGSWTFSKQGQAECAEFIAERKVDVERLFTHRWRLEQAEEATGSSTRRRPARPSSCRPDVRRSGHCFCGLLFRTRVTRHQGG